MKKHMEMVDLPKNEIYQMSTRYCPKLDDQVILITSNDKNGFEQQKCLSSHLCREDDRTVCAHHSTGDERLSQTKM